jgi:peptidyl-prolyl cis-trans isomerase D
MTDTLYAWVAERRGFSMLRLTEADLTTPVAEPTDAELKAHYDAHIDRFTKAEAKRITYASLLPEAMAKDQPVDEATLKKLYDDRIANSWSPSGGSSTGWSSPTRPAPMRPRPSSMPAPRSRRWSPNAG